MNKLIIILIIGIIIGLMIANKMPGLYKYEPPTPIKTEIVEAPPLDAEVFMQIIFEFADKDRHTLKKLIDVAYAESGTRYNAYNYNTDKSEDYGVFQINSVHTKRFGDKFKTDWRENIRVAKEIFNEQGFRPWVAAKKLGLVL